MILSRRSLFVGGAVLLAAPAIVRVASLMPVSVPKFHDSDYPNPLYIDGNSFPGFQVGQQLDYNGRVYTITHVSSGIANVIQPIAVANLSLVTKG